MDEEELYIAPTIITGVSPDEPVMQVCFSHPIHILAFLHQEEIFGPIFPVITVSSRGEAVEFINQRENPLTMYIFSTDKVNVFTSGIP